MEFSGFDWSGWCFHLKMPLPCRWRRRTRWKDSGRRCRCLHRIAERGSCLMANNCQLLIALFRVLIRPFAFFKNWKYWNLNISWLPSYLGDYKTITDIIIAYLVWWTPPAATWHPPRRADCGRTWPAVDRRAPSSQGLPWPTCPPCMPHKGSKQHSTWQSPEIHCG